MDVEWLCLGIQGIGGVRSGLGEIIVGGGKAKIGDTEKRLDTA